MNASIITTTQHTTFSGTMYQQVFRTKRARFVVLLLLLSFVLQPIERAQADETAVVETSEVTAPETEPLEDSVDERAVVVTQVESNDTTEHTETVTPAERGDESVQNVTETVIEVAVEDASVIIPVTESLQASSTEENTELVITDERIEQTIDDYTTEIIDEVPVVTEIDTAGNVTADTPPDTIIETPATDVTATSTVIAESAIAVSTVSSDGMIQFDKSDCVTVADGSFYCQPKKSAEELSRDGLFALPDRDGDLEIYIQKSGELVQVTFNDVDDAAPYFDSISNTLVWHRMIDDRYHIVSHDLATGVEEVLTSDSVNNMEPTRAGDYTVWQRWSGDNWDIVLHDGRTSTILTTALEHDIAPKVRGTLVVWNRVSFDRTQTVELYDIKTGEYTSISDKEGGTISNPRMVIVYESTFANGDIVTKGYDIETGEITPLSAVPLELPEELPTPDSTGETRALIQAKTTTKEDLETNDLGTTTPSVIGPEPENATSTVTVSVLATSTAVFASSPSLAEELTLDLRPTASSVGSTTTDVVVPSFTPVGTTTAAEPMQQP